MKHTVVLLSFLCIAYSKCSFQFSGKDVLLGNVIENNCQWCLSDRDCLWINRVPEGQHSTNEIGECVIKEIWEQQQKEKENVKAKSKEKVPKLNLFSPRKTERPCPIDDPFCKSVIDNPDDCPAFYGNVIPRTQRSWINAYSNQPTYFKEIGTIIKHVTIYDDSTGSDTLIFSKHVLKKEAGTAMDNLKEFAKVDAAVSKITSDDANSVAFLRILTRLWFGLNSAPERQLDTCIGQTYSPARLPQSPDLETRLNYIGTEANTKVLEILRIIDPTPIKMISTEISSLILEAFEKSKSSWKVVLRKDNDMLKATHFVTSSGFKMVGNVIYSVACQWKVDMVTKVNVNSFKFEETDIDVTITPVTLRLYAPFGVIGELSSFLKHPNFVEGFKVLPIEVTTVQLDETFRPPMGMTSDFANTPSIHGRLLMQSSPGSPRPRSHSTTRGANKVHKSKHGNEQSAATTAIVLEPQSQGEHKAKKSGYGNAQSITTTTTVLEPQTQGNPKPPENRHRVRKEQTKTEEKDSDYFDGGPKTDEG